MRSLAQKTIGARQRRPRARPGLAGECEDRSVERSSHRKKYTRASNSRKTPIRPVLRRRPPPGPESYRAGRGRPHPESFTSRWGRVILFGSHTVCPLQLKRLERTQDVHVIAHALLPARSPSRKRKRRREQHLPRPSPNARRPNGPGAATRPLGPAPGAEAAAFPGTTNREKPTEASRIKNGEAGGRHPNSLSLAHEAFVKTVKPLPSGFLICACHLFPWAPRWPRPCCAQPHPREIPQPPRLY